MLRRNYKRKADEMKRQANSRMRDRYSQHKNRYGNEANASKNKNTMIIENYNNNNNGGSGKTPKMIGKHTVYRERAERQSESLLVSVRPHPADTSRSFGNARGEFTSVGKQIGRM